MRFLFVMDPMDRILPDKDTTFAMLRASQGRGHANFHADPKDLSVKYGELQATIRPVRVSDTAPHFTLGPPEHVAVADLDALFMRKDPPFDSAYLYSTLLLERVRGRTVLVNDPRGLRDANEKLYALHFSEHTPKTFVGSDPEAIFAFVDEVGGRGVIKPLYGAGGSGVMILARDDKNARSIVELLTEEGRRHVMVQEFLPSVSKGDKRVLLMDGEVLGAINRVPRKDEFRSNIHVGGSVEPCDLTANERAMVASIAPRLRQDGLYFVGLDIIGEKLTEVNVTSPTGIQQLSRHVGREVSDDVIAWVERRAAEIAASTKNRKAP
ncbi:MAG: glutathione synthase [Polyangiaceae bacterium]